MKNILVISTSLRAKSNSDALADEFVRGAVEAGNPVEKIELRGKKIAFCTGCLSCQKTQNCVINDDAREIAEKMMNADVIVFATPVYYYGMRGQMKTLLDRANPLYTTDYKFREIYLIATAAEDEESTPSGTVTGLQGWIDCYEKAKLSGVIFAGGVNGAGEINGHKALEEAYKAGSNV